MASAPDVAAWQCLGRRCDKRECDKYWIPNLDRGGQGVGSAGNQKRVVYFLLYFCNLNRVLLRNSPRLYSILKGGQIIQQRAAVKFGVQM